MRECRAKYTEHVRLSHYAHSAKGKLVADRTKRSQSSRNWRNTDRRRAPSRFGRYVRLTIVAAIVVALSVLLVRLILPPPTSDVFVISFETPEYRADEAYHLVPYPELEINATRWGWRLLEPGPSLVDPDSTIEELEKQLLNSDLESHDRLIVTVTAQGVSLGSKAYLIGGARESRTANDPYGGALKVDRLIETISKAGDFPKLLVLDAGDQEADPHDGRIANEFSRNLRAAVQETEDSRLWVLCSHDVQQRSQISDQFQESLFAHYVAEALDGRADQPDEEDESGKIDLRELYEYVRTQVGVWCEATGSARQSPFLTNGGGHDEDHLLQKEFIVATPDDETQTARHRAPWSSSMGGTQSSFALDSRSRGPNEPIRGRMAIGRFLNRNGRLALAANGLQKESSTPAGASEKVEPNRTRNEDPPSSGGAAELPNSADPTEDDRAKVDGAGRSNRKRRRDGRFDRRGQGGSSRRESQ